MLKKYSINAVFTETGRTFLIEALDLELGEVNEAAVQFLVAHPDVNKKDDNGVTLASFVNKKDNNGVTALFLILGHIPLTRLLIKAKANVNHIPDETFSNYSPLCGAADAGDLAMVNLLLENKALPNLRGAVSQVAPLYQASLKGHLPVVKVLLRHKAQIDITTPLDETPLYGAAGSIR